MVWVERCAIYEPWGCFLCLLLRSNYLSVVLSRYLGKEARKSLRLSILRSSVWNWLLMYWGSIPWNC